MSEDAWLIINSLVMESPSGWWLRLADHDDIFYHNKNKAIVALFEILSLYKN
jgi:hypothetical protein